MILRDSVGVPADQVDYVIKRAFEHAACDQLEIALLPRITRANLNSYLELRGLDRLSAALERGRGAVLYSAHVRGHFLFFAALGLLGPPPNIVGMPLDPDASQEQRRAFDRLSGILTNTDGCRLLFMANNDFGLAVRAVNALRANELVTFEIDHSHSEHNVNTSFLGRTARFPVGPLLVARAARAPCLPFWLHRPPGWTPQVAEIGEPIDISDDIEESLRRLVIPLESSIRRHPESWATWLFPDVRLFVEDA